MPIFRVITRYSLITLDTYEVEAEDKDAACALVMEDKDENLKPIDEEEYDIYEVDDRYEIAEFSTPRVPPLPPAAAE